MRVVLRRWVDSDADEVREVGLGATREHVGGSHETVVYERGS